MPAKGVTMQFWELLSEAVSSRRLLLRWVDEPLALTLDHHFRVAGLEVKPLLHT